MASQPSTDKVTWGMELKGHEFGLEDLKNWTAGNSIRVAEHDGDMTCLYPWR